MKRAIHEDCSTLAKDLTSLSNHYTDGLICGKEFIYKAVDLVLTVNQELANLACSMRIDICGDCPAVKEVGSPEHEAVEKRHNDWVNDQQ